MKGLEGRLTDLRLVQGREERQLADSDTGKEPARHHHAFAVCGRLEYTTDEENGGTDGNYVLSGIFYAASTS